MKLSILELYSNIEIQNLTYTNIIKLILRDKINFNYQLFTLIYVLDYLYQISLLFRFFISDQLPLHNNHSLINYYAYQIPSLLDSLVFQLVIIFISSTSSDSTNTFTFTNIPYITVTIVFIPINLIFRNAFLPTLKHQPYTCNPVSIINNFKHPQHINSLLIVLQQICLPTLVLIPFSFYLKIQQLSIHPQTMQHISREPPFDQILIISHQINIFTQFNSTVVTFFTINSCFLYIFIQMQIQASDTNFKIDHTALPSFSNQVLRRQTQKKVQYYLPAYLRMTVRKVHHIQLESSAAQVSGTLIFSTYYKGLPPNQQMTKPKKLKQQDYDEDEPWYARELMNKMQITLNGQDEFTFASESDMFIERALRITHDQDDHLYSYIVRETFDAQVDGNIVLTPFETLNVYIQFTLRTIQCDWRENNKKVQLRFNFMDTNQQAKLLIKLRCDAGQYSVAQKRCSMAFVSTDEEYNKQNPDVHQNIDLNDVNNTLKRVESLAQSPSKKGPKTKLDYFQHGHAKIVLYKHPFTTIFSVMMPMWILAVIVQLSFFQSNDLGGRIASVAIALVAYMAFIPSVRQKIPPSPQFTYIQFVIFCLLTTSMLCVIRGYLDNGIQDYYYSWSEDPLFIISLVLNSLTFVITMVLVVIFYTFLKKSYTNEGSKKSVSFDRTKWRNSRADNLFKGKLSPALSPLKQENSRIY